MRRWFYPAAALALLTALNFFNYVDRSVLAAVQPLIQSEFQRGDADLGWLTSLFFFCYMVTAPFIGVLADRYQRKCLVAVGALLWSGATFITAITHNYGQLLFRHTVVGIGEASFVTIAPALLADLFPERLRGRMLSVFYMAIPAGSACGYLLGGPFPSHSGGRAPFYVAWVPGIALGVQVFFLVDPHGGAMGN